MARLSAIQPWAASTNHNVSTAQVAAGTSAMASRKRLTPLHHSRNRRSSQLPRLSRDVHSAEDMIWDPETDHDEIDRGGSGLGRGKRRAGRHPQPNPLHSGGKTAQMGSAFQHAHSDKHAALRLHAQDVPTTGWVAKAVSKDMEGRLLVYASHPKYPTTIELCPTEVEASLYVVCCGLSPWLTDVVEQYTMACRTVSWIAPKILTLLR